MSGLQEAFYIIGIIFMSVMLILVIGLVFALFRIKGKVNKIYEHIEERVDVAKHIAEKSGELAAFAGGKIVNKAKKAIGKKK